MPHHRAPRRLAATARVGAALLALVLAICENQTASETTSPSVSPNREAVEESDKGRGINQIRHIIVIYLENRSFDNMYGEFPGADGLSSAMRHRFLQVDSSGHPYQFLPEVVGSPLPTTISG